MTMKRTPRSKLRGIWRPSYTSASRRGECTPSGGFKELEKALLKDGWKHVDTRGSHCQYKHPTKPGKVTIPNHKGDINIKTANSILKMAGLK